MRVSARKEIESPRLGSRLYSAQDDSVDFYQEIDFLAGYGECGGDLFDGLPAAVHA